jgi:hypothetical protein
VTAPPARTGGAGDRHERQAVLTAMLPEHLLLAGIVAAARLEIAAASRARACALAWRRSAAACAAALGSRPRGYAAAPFPGQFSVAPRAPRQGDRSASPCRCC